MNIALGSFLNNLTKQGSIDLHVHSTASDGSFSPEEVFILAKENQLNCLALTDHDTNEGVLELMDNHISLDQYMQDQQMNLWKLSKQIESQNLLKSPLIIPGIELNVEFEKQNVHLLAYFSGYQIKNLNNFLKLQRKNRFVRNKKMINKLHELNIPIPSNTLDPTFSEPVPGRVKTAKWLVKNDYVNSIQEAFDFYLGDNKAAYVPREKVKIEEALQVIDEANGFPVIAHPHQYGWCQSQELLNQKIQHLLKITQLGIEVFHSDASLEQQILLWQCAEENNLFFTAGSDFHGANKEGHDMYTASDSPFNHYGKK